MNPVMFSKKSDNWATPKNIVAVAESMFGRFTLDCCADYTNAVCERYFGLTARDGFVDGLSQRWYGNNVWMNPPYSQVGKWMEKAYNECLEHVRTQVVCLVPARTDARWFHNFAQHANEIIFLQGRIRFVGGKSVAPFPSVIIRFGSWFQENTGYNNTTISGIQFQDWRKR
jgi:site-specific DNA-methyltransferase (adenine-specific)